MGQKLSKIKENFIFFSPKLPKTPPKNPKKRKSPPGKRFFLGVRGCWGRQWVGNGQVMGSVTTNEPPRNH